MTPSTMVLYFVLFLCWAIRISIAAPQDVSEAVQISHNKQEPGLTVNDQDLETTLNRSVHRVLKDLQEASIQAAASASEQPQKLHKKLRQVPGRKRCLSLWKKFGAKAQKRVWKQMFRCFWSWLTDLGPIKAKKKGGGRRRKQRQKMRGELSKQKQLSAKSQMSSDEIQRNRELLKETFKKLNGYYKAQ